MCASPSTGLPVLPLPSSSIRADIITPAELIQCLSCSLPRSSTGLPLNLGGSASTIKPFEACSMFTHVSARMVAESPNAILLHQSASIHVVGSMTATNRNNSCWVGFAPTERRHLSTAHLELAFISILSSPELENFSASRFENLADIPKFQHAVRREQPIGFLILQWFRRSIYVRHAVPLTRSMKAFRSVGIDVDWM